MLKKRLNGRLRSEEFVQWAQEQTNGLGKVADVESLQTSGLRELQKREATRKKDGVPGALGDQCSFNTVDDIGTFLANANSLIALNSFRSESVKLFEVPVRNPPSPFSSALLLLTQAVFSSQIGPVSHREPYFRCLV